MRTGPTGVVIRALRYGTTMGLNLNDPGSGVNILAKSSVPLYQDVAEKAELYGLLARQLRRGLREADVFDQGAGQGGAWKAKACSTPVGTHRRASGDSSPGALFLGKE